MQIRGKGNAFAVGVGNWAVGTFWNQVSPVALDQMQWRFYCVFVAWSKLAIYSRSWLQLQFRLVLTP